MCIIDLREIEEEEMLVFVVKIIMCLVSLAPKIPLGRRGTTRWTGETTTL